MASEHLVSIQELCIHYNADVSFINALTESGLVDTVVIEEVQYVEEEQLKDIEKMIRLHYELDINIEGIEAIFPLLEKVNSLQEELTMIRNKLRFYEER